ncbi:MAG: malate synthase A [Arenimonas sp.]|nr:malate synthase A [Arenimonas sp.]MBP7917303.1 malate synthase A [Arenimonas sp.]
MPHAQKRPELQKSQIQHAPLSAGPDGDVLSQQALDFLVDLHTGFEQDRQALLQERGKRKGMLPQFLEDTASIRASTWKAEPIPQILQDRRVEITGPVDAKTVINALNSDANVFMADFEDSTAPTWANVLAGQDVLRAAVRGDLSFSQDVSDAVPAYTLKPERKTLLMVRPRGLHLDEKHVLVDGEPMSGLLFDLGLFAFHNAKALAALQRGPFFYIPKLQSYAEAQWINSVLDSIEKALDLPEGQIKITVLIETLPAAFQMDEIIHALKSRVAGLNCGRWDYIFSAIKTLHHQPGFMLPERGQIAMGKHFLNSYAQLLIQTCHKRGILAMGGMAAQIPNKRDAEANALAFEKVRNDKQREADLGHDGTWVAHPGLIPLARGIFDKAMPGPNQTAKQLDLTVDADDLLRPCHGSITAEGFINTVEVCVRYLAAWLSGVGCVAIHGLMEDAATAEICRSQLWLWLHRKDLHLSDGTLLCWGLFDAALLALPNKLKQEAIVGHDKVDAAIALLESLVRAPELADFLTVPAYEQI